MAGDDQGQPIECHHLSHRPRTSRRTGTPSQLPIFYSFTIADLAAELNYATRKHV